MNMRPDLALPRSSGRRTPGSTATRYAVYFSPDPSSPLGRIGAQWLGRSIADPRRTGVEPVPFLSGERQREIIRLPAHYGFHATLKPPFRLKTPFCADDLRERLAALAASHSPLSLQLAVTTMQDFICLRPTAPSPGINALAADVVRRMDGFRERPDEAELARRRKAGLSGRQERLLAAWGYPYVLDEYRFHMTLTAGGLTGREAELLSRHLHQRFGAALDEPVPIDGLRLFVEEGGQPLVESAFFPLG